MTVIVLVIVLTLLAAASVAGSVACLSAQRGISLRAEAEEATHEL